MSFSIVTYCSSNFVEALQLNLASWLNNSDASKIHIYSDIDHLNIPLEPPQTELLRIHDSTSANQIVSWARKIDCIQHAAIRQCDTERLVWLDADCYVTGPLHGMFPSTPSTVAAMRLIGRCVRGHAMANAGVIALTLGRDIPYFFDLWRQRAAANMEREPKWHEQLAFSELVIEAFDGLHPFGGAVISEKLWNCEHDAPQQWLADIARYKPKVLHMKNFWWQDHDLRRRALEALQA